MNDQQTYDTVVAHLRKQNARSAKAGTNPLGHPSAGSCLYRNQEGLKCAAGCLIPDAKYREEMEGHNCDRYPVLGILQEEGHSIRLVRDLQKVHDAAPIHGWEIQFLQLAEHYRLTYTPPPVQS